MAEDISLEEYKKAYREIVSEEEKRGFFVHLVVYVLVNVMLIAINFIYSPGDIWFFYPLIGWGIGISMHYLFGVYWIQKELTEKEAKAEYRVREIKKGDKKMPTITHFMVPADDMERAKKFYAKLFDWKIEKFPGPIDYYAITTTAENGEEGLGGGLGKREEPQDTIVNYVDVPSVDEYIGKVKKLGGKVVVPKTAVPGIGYAAVCIDTENNTFGLWECDEDAKMNQCESCGMPLDEKTTSKFDDRYCIHCQDPQNGELASKEQVREGSIKAAMKFMGKTREEAEKMADEMMPKLPRWRE